MIEVLNISKSFPDKKVLDGIEVTFETGKTNLIIGQSGSGKTVLMKSLVGLVEVDEGDISKLMRAILYMTDETLPKCRLKSAKSYAKSLEWYFREEHCSIRLPF